jgi:hypothetical protein
VKIKFCEKRRKLNSQNNKPSDKKEDIFNGQNKCCGIISASGRRKIIKIKEILFARVKFMHENEISGT